MFNLKGNLRFKDDEAYKNFLAALEIVYAEGRVVPIEGVTSITTEIDYQGAKFPLKEFRDISSLVVGPEVEFVSIPLVVGTDEKTVTFWRTRTIDKVILKSESDSIVCFCFTFLCGENRHTVEY